MMIAQHYSDNNTRHSLLRRLPFLRRLELTSLRLCYALPSLPLLRGSQSENGYKVWSSQGVLLTTVPLESAYQVMWRPRPSAHITKEREKEVLSTLRDK